MFGQNGPSIGPSEIIAAISALAAIGAAIYSRRANAIAKKANAIADRAYKLAEKQDRYGFPHFELVSFIHNPELFDQFSNEKTRGENYKPLDEELEKKVLASRHRLSFIEYKGTEYLLINILDENNEAQLDKVRVYLGILQMEYINRRRDAKTFKVIKSLSTLSGGEKLRLKEYEFPVRIGRKDGLQSISINVAYAHSERQKPSIMTERFYAFKEENKIIDFLEDKNYEIALDVFNFSDSAFITFVDESEDSKQTQTVHIKMNSYGKIDVDFDQDPLN